jgi:hypothetical protein
MATLAPREPTVTRQARAGRCRPFGLLDAMLLVAATAVGLTLANVFERGQMRLWRIPPDQAVQLPCLAAWTVTVFFLRLRRPRPPLRVAFRQPGLVATAAASFLLLPAAAVYFLSRVAKVVIRHYGWLRLNGVTDWRYLVPTAILVVGAVVTGAWLSLLFSGRRRTEPGWLDALGRVLGAVWVAHVWLMLGAVLIHYR